MIRFMAATGMRAGEVSGLHIGDLDLLRKRLYVRRTRTKVKGGWEVSTTKTGKERLVKLSSRMCQDLAAYLATHPYKDDRDHTLWPGRTNGGQERFKHAPALSTTTSRGTGMRSTSASSARRSPPPACR